MGCTGAKRFFKIIIPLCIPTILAAALMVFMRAFADFGTPLFIGEGYRTFPVEIYNQFMNETGSDKNFASAVSIIAIIITSLIFLLQRYINGKYKFTMNALHPIEAKEIKGIKSVLADYYDTDFDSDEEDFLVNKSNKQLIEKLIINLKNDDELDVSNKSFFIKEALQLLAKNTGCVEDEEISDEILEKLLVKQIITPKDEKYYTQLKSTKRWT